MPPFVRPGFFKPWPTSKRYTFKVPREYITCCGKRVRRRVITVIGVGSWVFPYECDCKRKNRKRRKRGKKYRVSTSHTRLRERNLQYERIGDVVAGSKLGDFKIYQNSVVQSSTLIHSTGSHVGSIAAERTWDATHPGPPYNIVGPFASVKTKISGAGKTPVAKYKSILFSPGRWWEYEGAFLDDGNWLTEISSNFLLQGIPSISGYDTLAWDKLKPKIPKADMGQFIYELRDLPRSLKTSFDGIVSSYRNLGGISAFAAGGKRSYSDASVIMNPRSVSDHFLNHEFGWRPLFSDYGKFIDAFTNVSDHISRITRDNGKWIRRRVVLQQETTQQHIGRQYYPGVDPWGFNIQGTCSDFVVDGVTCKGYFDITSIVETKTWATGYFTYYRPEFDMEIPLGNSYLGAVQRLMTLYGLRINPHLLWKITPWTWAIDWGTHVGDYLKRLDDFVVDGIVSRNVCIMQSMKRYAVKTAVINFGSGARTFVWKKELSTKARKVADSPYGFDLSWNNLSARQWAILGAIGVSRSANGFIARGA